MLDAAGLDYVDVFASGGLDEHDVAELVAAGAPIAGFGVGTKLGVSAAAPWTDCAYKLVEFDGNPVLKLSTGKETLAGRKQVWRVPDGSLFGHDIIARADEPVLADNAVPLLHKVIRDGKRITPSPTVTELRDRFTRTFARLPDPLKALRSPAAYSVDPPPRRNSNSNARSATRLWRGS
jgi:nicotinate phosphoribosyltransferase